ncbi:hypothetical protein TIFTF001_035416 [Ficus carica]|uniref:Uncharacterized protein n=1 Tax=Ficus carica TaxID=3494 RepID=A0AA88E2E9_FICCA|nr:hypothetical protein TIFTF001_035416 [Ficus carica]
MRLRSTFSNAPSNSNSLALKREIWVKIGIVRRGNRRNNPLVSSGWTSVDMAWEDIAKSDLIWDLTSALTTAACQCNVVPIIVGWSPIWFALFQFFLGFGVELNGLVGNPSVK